MITRVHLQKFLQKQKEKIERDKWYEGIKLGHDPGQQFIMDWINKNAKRFRKEYVLDDIKEGLSELKAIRKGIDEYMKKIIQLTDFANVAEEKLMEAIEFLEVEKEKNDNNGEAPDMKLGAPH